MWKDSMQVRDKEDICGRKYGKDRIKQISGDPTALCGLSL